MKQLLIILAILMVTLASMFATPVINVDNTPTPHSQNVIPMMVNFHLLSINLHTTQEEAVLNQIIVSVPSIDGTIIPNMSNFRMRVAGIQVSNTVLAIDQGGAVYFNNCSLNLPLDSTIQLDFYADIDYLGPVGLHLHQQDITAMGVNSNTLAQITGQFPISGNMMTIFQPGSIPSIEILDSNTPVNVISGEDTELLRIQFTSANNDYLQIRALTMSVLNNFNLLPFIWFKDLRWTNPFNPNWVGQDTLSSFFDITTPIWYGDYNNNFTLCLMGKVIAPDANNARIDIGLESQDYLWISGNPQVVGPFPQRKTIYINQPVVTNSDPTTPAIPGISIKSYPNPFNTETNIDFSLPKAEKVKLEIYNIKGQLVKTLINEAKNAGSYQTKWNGTDNNNNTSVASGEYIYMLSTKSKVITGKMILMK